MNKTSHSSILLSMKFRDVFFDCATVVGSCVGVGFISGKEAEIYFGSFSNVPVFACTFFLLCFVVRRFCVKKHCNNTIQLFQCCFGRFNSVFLTLFCFCCIVCISTLLAGADSCLQTLLWSVNFPCYSFAIAVCAAFILKKGFKTLKILNAISLVLVLFYLLLALIFCPGENGFSSVSVGMPIVYAMFSTTTSLGVIVPLSKGNVRHNLLLSFVSAAVLALLTAIVLLLCDFSLPMPLLGRNDNVFFNSVAVFAVIACVICGVTANATPVFECVRDVFCDDAFCCVALCSLAWALSLFGFDFALRYGYFAIAFLCTILICTIFASKKSVRLGVAS